MFTFCATLPHRFTTTLAQDLQQTWRRGFVSALYDSLQASYNLYERDEAAFRTSVLHRLLRRVHYIMADQLRVLTR